MILQKSHEINIQILLTVSEVKILNEAQTQKKKHVYKQFLMQ
jgi:hypothetical protein